MSSLKCILLALVTNIGTIVCKSNVTDISNLTPYSLCTLLLGTGVIILVCCIEERNTAVVLWQPVLKVLCS